MSFNDIILLQIYHGLIMELTLDEALQKAIEAHKTGQIQEAERLYTAILQAQPKHPDANHNMGVLAAGVGTYKGHCHSLKQP